MDFVLIRSYWTKTKIALIAQDDLLFDWCLLKIRMLWWAEQKTIIMRLDKFTFNELEILTKNQLRFSQVDAFFLPVVHILGKCGHYFFWSYFKKCNDGWKKNQTLKGYLLVDYCRSCCCFYCSTPTRHEYKS